LRAMSAIPKVRRLQAVMQDRNAKGFLEAAEAAAREVRELACGSGAKINADRAFVAAGVIPVLVSVLEGVSVRFKAAEEAAWVLRDIATNSDAFRDKMVEAGVVPALVRVLNEADPASEIAEHAAAAVANIADGSNARANRAVVAGFVPALVRVLREAPPESMATEQAAWALGHLALHTDHVKVDKEPETAARRRWKRGKAMVSMLQGNMPARGRNEGDAEGAELVEIVVPKTRADRVVDEGAVPLLLKVLRESSTGSYAAAEAAGALASIAHGPEVHANLVIVGLVGLLTSEPPGSCAAEVAGRTLWNIMKAHPDGPFLDRVCLFGALPALVRVLEGAPPGSGAAEEAAGVLELLAKAPSIGSPRHGSNSRVEHALSSGALPALLRALCEGANDTAKQSNARKAAASALLQVATSASGKKHMREGRNVSVKLWAAKDRFSDDSGLVDAIDLVLKRL